MIGVTRWGWAKVSLVEQEVAGAIALATFHKVQNVPVAAKKSQAEIPVVDQIFLVVGADLFGQCFKI